GASGTATDTFTNGVLRPSVTTGQYTVAVTATGTLAANGAFGAQTKVKSVTLLVRPQDFNLTQVGGNTASFNSPGSATSTMSVGSLPSATSTAVTSQGFAGTVTLTSSSVLNSGSGSLTIAFNNTSPTFSGTNPSNKRVNVGITFSGTATATATFTVTITGTATLAGSGPAGTAAVTVTGPSGSLTHAPTVTITVSDYTVTASPTSVSALAGATATSTIPGSPVSGFTGTVPFTSTVSPAGLTC